MISTENANQSSSAAKGETFEDTIKIVGYYCDCIVLRHTEEGAAARAAEYSSVPIINAGDGKGQHPTQALLDLYTIQQKLGQVDGLCVGFVGDLANGRTVHSLVYLLTKFVGIRMVFVSHESLKVPSHLLEHLDQHGVKYSETTDLEGAVRSVDVLYVTRVQREQFDVVEEYDRVKHAYQVDTSVVSQMGHNSIILHPLPRVGELPEEVDDNPRAAYFDQARNGLPLRMALLEYVLEEH